MGQVRIIAGQWRRRLIPVPDRPGLRPTPDRVRETVFNWLEHLLDRDWSGIQVLDAFAGTGVLGFEAASRGAMRVTLVDKDRDACEEMLRLCATLKAPTQQIQVLQADALRHLSERPRASLDLIFLDPPFRQALLEPALAAAALALRPGGLMYVESERPMDEWLAGQADRGPLAHLELIRSLRAGQVMAGLLSSRKSEPSTTQGREHP